jgi:hypothetical protein
MSTILIATDEAGYGPKLGPLVISGTVWNIPGESIDDQYLNDLFAPLREPWDGCAGPIVVDDSKAVFKPSQGLEALHAVVSAAIHWSGNPAQTLVEWLHEIASKDLDSILHTAWFEDLGEHRFLDRNEIDPLIKQWTGSGLQLLRAGSRIISARQFNSACAAGCNKADLLSESTIGLVHSLIDICETRPAKVVVFCDRHGGRRYYGGVLQHCFPDWQLRVIDETKRCSRYQLMATERTIDFSFTVKGDSFTPVALSSMIAKYLRERLMGSFNEYFAARHQGPDPLQSTAGYPVDADRYLSDIQPIVESEKIARDDLIRSR